MSEAQPACRLIVAVETDESARKRLEAALSAGGIASVIILPQRDQPLVADLARPLVSVAQQAGAAALILDEARLARALGADGVHLQAGSSAADYEAARELLGRGSIVGADAGRSRDAAMRLGEAGADYIGFGIPDFVTDRSSARERRLDLIQWWAEIFEVPCVALDVDAQEDAEELARAGADFVAIRLAGSTSTDAARDAVRAALAALSAPVS
ncbi:MAG: thiamine phosphate synthase [Bacteroidota bacterium]